MDAQLIVAARFKGLGAIPADSPLFEAKQMRITDGRKSTDSQGEPVRKNTKLQKRSMEKSRLLHILSHDLRNPISGILSASECLLEELSDASNEHVTLLQAIYSSSQFMLRLVDDILEVSIIESGVWQFHFQLTDLVSLVKQDLVLNRLMAARKRIHLDLNTRNHETLIFADPLKIYQVIDKLVTNAIRFSYPDSGIEIRIRARGAKAILSVRDRGVGIPPAEVRTVLMPFRKSQQLDPQRPTPASGLATAMRIVERHGGQMSLASHLGKGSTFTVSLPLREVNGRNRAATSPT
jgi:signal transduction histidine kinase